ncbi:hypothetical protein B4U79_17538 [Dinothrombium tinctorium]|uniref:CARD domain-containing protein n=1 Tax=Dinothrombium tinctorium TaxID=1965070 RepID=A0A3S3NV87_9ACAR|nr:hypothetical protein B4U79_16187 [Dinothrombium tinctorium]RWS11334.1 hypothetical protein B4U79_17539 [Dinothrombium tinctorium]RWS11337.1 hypothetical protein B4U79_17538 [Dinothrombium tinctorium]
MKQNERQALINCKYNLMRDIQTEYLADELCERDVINYEDKNYIWFGNTFDQYCHSILDTVTDSDLRDQKQRERVERLIEVLLKKNTDCFDQLIEVLSSAYPWLSMKLRDTVLQLDLMSADKIDRCIPFQERNLVRTEVIVNVRNELRRLGCGKKCVLIHGTILSGKTVTAAEVVREWTDSPFTDGIFWLNVGKLENALQVMSKLEELYEKVSHSKCSFMDFPSATNAIRKCVANRRTLVVLDDVWNAKDMKLFNIGCALLVTSQHTNVLEGMFERHSPNVSFVDIGTGLSQDDSLAFLTSWIRAELSDEAKNVAQEICDLVQGNPFCLAIIGNYMESDGDDVNKWQYLKNKLTDDNSRPFQGYSTSDYYDYSTIKPLIEERFNSFEEETQDYLKYFIAFPSNAKVPSKVIFH